VLSSLLFLAIGYLCTMLNQVSYVMMKQVQIQFENQPNTNSFFQCKWLTAYGLLWISSIITVLIIPYIDLVLISTQGAVAVIFSVILSVFWLKETFILRYDLPALTVIILGSVLMVLLANEKTEPYSLDQLHALTYSPAAIIYLSIYFVLLLLSGIAYKKLISRLSCFHAVLSEKLQQEQEPCPPRVLLQLLNDLPENFVEE